MKVADAIGKQFNHLFVVRKARAGGGGKRLKILVRCLYDDCGEEFEARIDNVVEGRTKSCGCAPPVYRKPRLSKQLKDAVWKAADKIAIQAEKLIEKGT